MPRGKSGRSSVLADATRRVHADKKGDPMAEGSMLHVAHQIDLALIDLYGFRNIDAERKLEELSARLRGTD